MGETILEIGSRLGTPLAVGGFAIAGLLYVFGLLLKAKRVPILSRRFAETLVERLVKYLYWLALLALVFGTAAFIVGRLPVADPEVSGTLSRKNSGPIGGAYVLAVGTQASTTTIPGTGFFSLMLPSAFRTAPSVALQIADRGHITRLEVPVRRHQDLVLDELPAKPVPPPPAPQAPPRRPGKPGTTLPRLVPASCETTDSWWRSGSWVVDANLEHTNPKAIGHGWLPVVDPSYDNAPIPGANGGILVLHPLTASQPAVLSFRSEVTVPQGAHIRLRVVGSPYGDGVLSVYFNRTRLESAVVTGSPWRTLDFDLSSIAGQTGRLEVRSEAGGANAWSFETTYIDAICYP